MLKKVTLLCILAMLLSFPIAASPIEQGNIAVTVPLLKVGGIVGFGDSGEFSNWSFDDDGWIVFAGTRQFTIDMLYALSSSWHFGYFIIDGLEAGLNVLYLKDNSWDDAFINLGLNATYYLDMNGLMPFISAGFTLVDITEEDKDTAINASVGAAYAVKETIAPYFALASNTYIDSGTHIDIDFGVKFMF
ncbi:MAG: hypothetical protein ACP5IA_07055 [Sediminispirochaetaceae bacterium]